MIPTRVSQKPRWLLWGTSFSCSLTFTHQTSSAIPQAPPQALALLAKGSPALSPSAFYGYRGFQRAEHSPGHTRWWFLMRHSSRAERRRQIREVELDEQRGIGTVLPHRTDTASQCFSALTMPQSQSCMDLLKQTLLGPAPRASDSVGLGWSPRICASDRIQVALALLKPSAH